MDQLDEGIHPDGCADRGGPGGHLQVPAEGQQRSLYVRLHFFLPASHTGRELCQRCHPSPEMAAISTPARIEPIQRSSEMEASTLAPAGGDGSSAHLGMLRCTRIEKITASKITVI